MSFKCRPRRNLACSSSFKLVWVVFKILSNFHNFPSSIVRNNNHCCSIETPFICTDFSLFLSADTATQCLKFPQLICRHCITQSCSCLWLPGIIYLPMSAVNKPVVFSFTGFIREHRTKPLGDIKSGDVHWSKLPLKSQ